MIMRRFELLLPRETDIAVVLGRFLRGVVPLDELEHNPSWFRRKLVGRVEWGVLYWQCLASTTGAQVSSPAGRATLEVLEDGIRVNGTIELPTLHIVGWCIVAGASAIIAILGSPNALLLPLAYSGWLIFEVENLRRALVRLLVGKAAKP